MASREAYNTFLEGVEIATKFMGERHGVFHNLSTLDLLGVACNSSNNNGLQCAAGQGWFFTRIMRITIIS